MLPLPLAPTLSRSFMPVPGVDLGSLMGVLLVDAAEEEARRVLYALLVGVDMGRGGTGS